MTVSIERDGPVLVVRLDRAERHNSLVPELVHAITDAFTGLDATTGAVVLEAVGRSFSTGGDLGGFWEHRGDIADYADDLVGGLNQAIVAMLACPVPIVTAVHGQVTGGSLGLILASDVVLVSPTVTFRPWYTTVGFSPDGGWMAMLPDIIGRARVRDVILRDREIPATQALSWGIVSEIVEGDVRAVSRVVAHDLAGRPRSAMHHAVLASRPDREAVEAGLEDERRRFVSQITSAEALEGIRCFVGV